MRPLPLSQLARWTNGRVVGEDVEIGAVVTDTRALPGAPLTPASGGGQGATPPPRGPMFVALKGERFDGHDHVAAAVRAGVVAALVSRESDASIPQLVVADTQRALADIARGIQHGRPARRIAVTGSNGKTSVKALALSTLQVATRDAPGAAYATPGNRNNEIGVPLAVIDAPEHARYALYEMGTGAPGDIAYLTAIVRPDVALVNNIAPAHLERMGTLLEIANTKAAVYDDLAADGVAVINADDAFAPYFAERAHGRRLIRFALDATAEVTAHDVVLGADGSTFVLDTPAGRVPVRIVMPGRHNVRNALAAAGIALGLGIGLDAIAAGLARAQPVDGRLVARTLASGATLIDDSYNANPGSLAAAIDTLASTGAGQAWLVLGDMRELGDDAPAMHAEIGRRAKAAGIARLYTLGGLSAHAARAFGPDAQHFDDHDALAHALAGGLQPGVRVLVKGSRGSRMDRVVQALLDGENTP